MLCCPEIAPVSSVRGGEPVVLNEDGDEEPEDDFAPEDGFVERGNFARGGAVVGWETNEEG